LASQLGVSRSQPTITPVPPRKLGVGVAGGCCAEAAPEFAAAITAGEGRSALISTLDCDAMSRACSESALRSPKRTSDYSIAIRERLRITWITGRVGIESAAKGRRLR